MYRPKLITITTFDDFTGEQRGVIQRWRDKFGRDHRKRVAAVRASR